MDAQLKRGILNICILQLLKEKDRYGYDIIKILQGFFPDTEESTLYAILRRLHKEGLTRLYTSGEISHGPPRKYYKISDKGKEALQQAVSSWRRIEAILQEIGISSSSL
ncbi:MAG: PadR family transcriptional regulator [Oscillospiraceae bacterium]|nr:PadR family transcriptional regulator [Oscillospiraceae bacterium]